MIPCKHNIKKCEKCKAYFCTGVCEFWGCNSLALGMCIPKQVNASMETVGDKKALNISVEHYELGLCEFCR